ncbi:MAG: cell division ATP-binding protein FtsE [Tissierellales bacterium]|nr:cell division ATP-binding protein FtsE [Tissierellales bacterium]
MIDFINVSMNYGSEKKVLDRVNLHIEKGEFVFLVGSSGAGKSTIIKLLMKEIEPTGGRIILNNKDITSVSNRKIPYIRRELGVVFQDFRLLPQKTVFENIAFAMEIVGASSRSIKRQVPIVLNMVGLQDKGNYYPAELSGGERQKVSIARAIINNPSVLVADEPTGNLDPNNAWEIMKLIKYINKRGTTVIMATHANQIVDMMKRRVIQIHDGKIIRDTQRGVYDEA